MLAHFSFNFKWLTCMSCSPLDSLSFLRKRYVSNNSKKHVYVIYSDVFLLLSACVINLLQYNGIIVGSSTLYKYLK